MSRKRLLIVYGLLALLVGGHLFDAALDREHWPFSNYPMYARPAGSTMMFCEFFGVVDDGHGGRREVPMDPRWAPGLPIYKFEARFSRLPSDGQGPVALRQLLDGYLTSYNRLRKAGLNSGPPLVAIRMYRVEVPLQIPLLHLPDEGPVEAPIKRALAEVDQTPVKERQQTLPAPERAPEDRS